MKHLKTIFACLLMAVLSIGQVWASNWTGTSDTNAPAGTYKAMVSGETVVDGDTIIVVSGTIAMSTTQNNNNRGIVTVLNSASNTITLDGTKAVQALEVATSSVTGKWTLHTKNGYLYAPSYNATSGNYLRTETTDKSGYGGDWSISYNQVLATKGSNTGSTKVDMRYNSGSSIISCYSVGNSTAITVYKKAHTVTYKGNGGSTTCADATLYKSNETVTLCSAEPTRNNYNFTGWTANVDVINASTSAKITAGTSIAAGTQIKMPAKFVVLTAQWEAAGGCSSEITITKGTPSHGNFDLSGAGTVCIDGGNASVTISNIQPAEGYRFKQITSSGGGDIDNDAKTVTNIGANTTINVEFETIPSHKAFFYNGATLLNEGGTSFAEGASVSYSGETPTSCDTGTGASTYFAGWATATWDGKVAKTAIVPNFYEGALPVMGGTDVTYYAVFCKGGPTFKMSYTFSDVVYYVGKKGSGSYLDAESSLSDAAEFGFESATGGYYVYYKDGNDKVYIGGTGGNTTLNTTTNLPDGGAGYIWTYTESEGALSIKIGSRYLGLNTSTKDRFSTYTSGYPLVKHSTAQTNYMTTCAAPTQCETPTFSVDAGTYNETKSVTLACTTDGATIYYTTDGTDPDDSKTEYTAAISVTQTTTIKAIAIKDGLTNSGIATATYTLKCATPTISPDGGTSNTGSQDVTLACTTEGATIYYSIDGGDPITEYTAPFTITANATVKAIASKSNWTDSELASADFTINTPRTVTFHAVGTLSIAPETTMTEATYGAGITLPSATPSTYCAAEGWTFAGWATSASTTVAPTLLAEASYDCAATDLYAVYVLSDGKYHKVTSTPATIPGKYLIVNEDAARSLKNEVVSSYYMGADEVTIENDEISSPAATSVWDVTYNTTKSSWIFKNGDYYLYNYGTNTYYDVGRKNSSVNGYSVSFDNGNAVFTSVDDTRNGGTHFIYYYHSGSSTHEFKAVANDDETKNLHLYRLDATYSSDPACCTDEVTIAVAAASNGSFTVEQNDADVIGSTLGTCTAAQTVTVTCNPNAGYHVDAVTENIGTGVTITETSTNVYTIEYAKNVTGTSTISVTFAATSDPSISVSTNNIALGNVAVGSEQKPTFTVEGANLVGSTLTLSSNNAKVTVDKASLTIEGGAVASNTITVTVNTDDEGAVAADITIADGATPTPNSVTVHVTANVQNQYTINWYDGATLLPESGTCLAGATITSKPADPTPCDASISFVGWTTADAWTGKHADAPSTLLAASAITTATADVTYRAVYAKVTEGGWRKTALTALTSTDVFVIANEGALDTYHAMRNDGTSSSPLATEITVANSKITSVVADNLKWNVSGNATDGYTFYPNGSTTTWLFSNTTASSSSNTNLRVGDGVRNLFEVASNTLKTKDTYTARYVNLYNANDWRGYTSNSTSTNLVYFKYVAPSTKDYMTTCAVTFDAIYQAGEGTGADHVVSNIAVPYTVLGNDATNFTKEGYKFSGWKENGTDRAAGYVYATVTTDLTFIAQWTEKADPEISFASSTCSVTFNGAVAEPAFTNTHSVPVTFTSGDETVATVDENTGEVTLVPNAIGSVVITATAAETEDYKAASVSYTLNIEDDLSGTWNLVTDVNDLIPGMKVIIAQHVDADGTIMTMGGQNGNNRYSISSTVAGNVLTPAPGTKVFTLVYVGDGKFAFQASTKNYLYAASSGSNYLKEQTNNNANGEWTISISAEGVATITAQGTNTHNWIQYNGSGTSNLFSAYLNAQSDVVIYAKPFDYTRETTQGRFGTICLPNGGVMHGADLFEVAYYGATSQKIFFDQIINGVMEAGIPYVFLPREGASKLGVYYTDAADAPAGNRNGLYGSYNEQVLAKEADNYILYNNQYLYVGSESTNVKVGANRAYIQLHQINPSEPALAPGRIRMSMGVIGAPQVTTGVGELNADETPVKVMIDGQLYIIRGEKMYDATGRLVK